MIGRNDLVGTNQGSWGFFIKFVEEVVEDNIGIGPSSAHCMAGLFDSGKLNEPLGLVEKD